VRSEKPGVKKQIIGILVSDQRELVITFIDLMTHRDDTTVYYHLPKNHNHYPIVPYNTVLGDIHRKWIHIWLLSILKYVHISISSTIFSKLYSVAISEYHTPLLLENCICIVALKPHLQRVSFCSVIDFLYHSFYY
jgi:hypothetical protein